MFSLIMHPILPIFNFQLLEEALLIRDHWPLMAHIDGLLEIHQASQICELSKLMYIRICVHFLRNRIHKFRQILNMVHEPKICSELSLYTNLDKSALRDFFRK